MFSWYVEWHKARRDLVLSNTGEQVFPFIKEGISFIFEKMNHRLVNIDFALMKEWLKLFSSPDDLWGGLLDGSLLVVVVS